MKARTLSVWLVSLVFCLLVHSQPANDECSNAIQILPSDLASTYSFSGTTTSSTKQHLCSPVIAGTGNPAGDVWFYFTPSENMLVDFSLCGSSFDTYLYIASGSCSSYSCLVASYDSLLCSTISRSFVQAFSMLQGMRYFIIVSGSNFNTGSYTLSVSKNTGSASCATATTIPSLPYSSPTVVA